MSTGAKLASAATAAAVIGVGWWLGSNNSDSSVAVESAAAPETTEASATTSASASATVKATSQATQTATSASGVSGTFTGSTESDRYGSLTVKVKLAAGKLTNITYTSTAHDGHSLQIESRAIPTLKSEAIAANSASIDSVSGATYTSAKYKTSLQSALDAAK